MAEEFIMRSLSSVALFVVALAAAAPAAAQVSSPGPVWHNQSGAPIPGAPGAPHTSPRYDPPSAQTGGPVYYNQSGNPIPGAPQQTGGPLYAGPQGVVSANPPHFNGNGPHGGGYGGPQSGNGRVWQNGRWVSMPATGHGYNGGNRDRWGQSVNGRWWGGSQAPGGWGGYRRPRRGGSLDHYWMQPGFQIPDYLSFGLAAPPYGTFWVRYYDDAVLIDAQGSVQASVSGIAWSSANSYAGDGYASSSASASASSGGYGQQGGQIGYVDPNPPYYSEPQGGYAPPAPYGQPAVQSQYYQGCPNTCPPQVYTQQGGGYGKGLEREFHVFLMRWRPTSYL